MLAILSLLALVAALPSGDDCVNWAKGGECTKNTQYMQEFCADACSKHSRPLDTGTGEPEQCVGWAEQGECTRNPKYMMKECPQNCKAQKAKSHESKIDDRFDCLDVATESNCKYDGRIAKDCAGTCSTHELCGAEADPPECKRALRCRELKDDWADCADRVQKEGCESSAQLLKHCYLSCARVGQEGLLRRFRRKITVRTRKHGYIDEEPRRSWRYASRPSVQLPCWKSTVYDPPPPATCNNTAAQLLNRWRSLAEPRCAAMRQETTPRAPPRRVVEAPLQQTLSKLSDEQQAPMTVVPVLMSPKVRLVENFVSAAEAEHVIEVGLPRMHRSLAGGRMESIRTSTTGMLPPNDPVVRRITERAALVTGYPYENIEPLQLVKYVDGQKYEPHFDYGEACDFEENLNNGHRHVTMLAYLNSVPEDQGGFTVFPKLNVRVSPVAYSAVVFNDCLPNGEEDPRTLHGGQPPSNHTKIAINIWIRAQARAGEQGGMMQALGFTG